MDSNILLLFSIGVIAYGVLYFVKPLRFIRNLRTRYLVDVALYSLAILYFLLVGIEKKQILVVFFVIIGLWILYKKLRSYPKSTKEA
jgi:hypothetical protein